MRQQPTGWIDARTVWLGICRELTLLTLLIGVLALMTGWPTTGFAETEAETGASRRVAVVYPNIGEPYGSIFVSIIKGIEAELDTPPLVIPVNDGDAQPLREQLSSANIGTCIALGRTALELLNSLQLDIPIVRGAILDPNVPAADDGDSPLGISLTPDPAFLLDHLKRLAPQITRVTVVYSDAEGQTLIDRAVEAGQHLGLNVVTHKAEDLMAAAAIYKSVVGKLGPHDALWIPQDPQAVDDKVILPMLLNAAWEQNFILFSSNADHAKRGVLYSVYPDNFSMGRRLARIAKQRLAGQPANAGMQPLQDLLMAVNLRAAEHLRLNLTPSQIRSFDLTFPQR